MEPDPADRIIDLVAEALERAPEERRAFLDAECGANEALRIEVESLIGQEEVAGEFLRTPAFAQEGKHLYDLEAGNLKPGEAESSLNESLALHARSAGEGNIGYSSTLGDLGNLKREEGDLGGAITAMRRQLAILNRVAPDDTKVVIAEINLCSSLIQARKFSDAEAMLESLKRDCRRIVGENDNMLYTNVLFVSELLDFEHGDFAKVATEGRNVLDRFKAYLSREEFFVVTADYVLGASLTRTGHAAEGEPLLRAALTDFNPVKRALFLVYGNAETALGDCLLAQKRYAEAEPLLLTGHDKLRQNPAEHAACLAASERLRDLYVAWNKPADAARYISGGTSVDTSSAR